MGTRTRKKKAPAGEDARTPMGSGSRFSGPAPLSWTPPIARRRMVIMGRKRQKQYTPEFRRNAVRMVVEGDRPIAEVARELEIPYGGLYEWVRKAAGNPRPGHGAPVVV